MSTKLNHAGLILLEDGTTSWLLIKSGFAKLPAGSTFRQLHAVAVVAGIGFTMSLFVGVLAYSDEHYLVLTRLGVLLGSFCSAICGYILLRSATPASH